MERLCTLHEYVLNLKSLTLDNCDFEVTGTENIRNGAFEYLTNCGISACSVTNPLLELIVGSPLKELSLDGDDDYRIDTICQMTCLTRLHFGHTVITDAELIQLTRKLDNLDDLHIEESAITLAGIKRLLEEPKCLELVYITLCPECNIEQVEVDVITSMVASWPSLHVAIAVGGPRTKVGRYILLNLIRTSFINSCNGSIFNFCQQIPDSVLHKSPEWLRLRNYRGAPNDEDDSDDTETDVDDGDDDGGDNGLDDDDFIHIAYDL